MKQLSLQNEYVLQKKYSDIQEETERKQPQQLQQNETKTIVTKVKLQHKLVEKKV